MIKESESGASLKSHYWSYLVQLGIITVIYFVIAKLSLALTGHPGPVWPPAGFALAVILLFGYRVWPGIAMGTFLEVVLEGLPVQIAIATAAGSAGGALAGAYLLKRMGFRNSLERLRDVLGLVVLACMVSTTISATFGALSFYLSGIIPWAASGSFWMTWWLGDVLGVIVVTPLVLVWCIRPHFNLKPVQIAEALALLISLVLVSDTVFSEPGTLLNSPYIMFPFLIWAALRFGQKGAITAIMIVSGIAIWHTAHGLGLFGKGTPAESLLFPQVFTGVVAFTILILVAVITEFKQGEELLCENKARLDLALKSAHMGVWHWDIIENIRYFDDQVCHLLGINPATFTGAEEEFFGAVHPEDLQTMKATLARTIEQNVLYEPDFRAVWPDGSIHYITARGRLVRDDKGSALRINGIIWDITERKKAEEALKENEERYRRLVKFSPYGIAIHSEGKLVYMNLAGAKILGTENPDDIVGKKLLQIVHPDYHDIAKIRIHMQEKGKVASPLDEKFVRLDGTSVDVEVTSIPFTYMGKLAMYGVFRDITERKKEEETRLENLRLETADKAKSEFLAAMSHELRTPLNAIIGFSDILSLEMRGNLNEKQKGYVNDIHNAGEHLLLIINDILDLSKVEAGEMELVLEKIPVNELLEETITLIKNKAMKNNIDIIRDIEPQIEFMEGDKTKIKQVLFNLLSNAVKFSREEGGTITIKARKEGDMAQISVSDTGIGIKEENVGKLFHKFEQLESGITKKYGGTGLGLAISKQLVELHGGKIYAESKYGEGSTFTLILPIQRKYTGNN